MIPADPVTSHAAIEATVGQVLAAGALPVVLGGDHSITEPSVRACAAAHGPVGMVHFDTHTDTGAEVFGVELSHGTFIRRLSTRATLDGSRYAQIGLRGYWPGEEEFAWQAERGITSLFMHDVRDLGIREVVRRAIAAVGPGPVYLTVDVDVLDPAFIPGTGTPEPGGMTAVDLLLARPHRRRRARPRRRRRRRGDPDADRHRRLLGAGRRPRRARGADRDRAAPPAARRPAPPPPARRRGRAGTTTTGTGECRTILVAREPRNTRAIGPTELEPTTSTSPSPTRCPRAPRPSSRRARRPVSSSFGTAGRSATFASAARAAASISSLHCLIMARRPAAHAGRVGRPRPHGERGDAQRRADLRRDAGGGDDEVVRALGSAERGRHPLHPRAGLAAMPAGRQGDRHGASCAAGDR